jgi:hypothetical protein
LAVGLPDAQIARQVEHSLAMDAGYLSLKKVEDRPGFVVPPEGFAAGPAVT